MPLPPSPLPRRTSPRVPIARAVTAIAATALLATVLAGCAAGLSAEADAWCKANPNAVLRAAIQLKEGGATNGWDPSKEQFQRSCQRAWDTKGAAGSVGPAGAPLPS